jgi:hypothetical protein
MILFSQTAAASALSFFAAKPDCQERSDAYEKTYHKQQKKPCTCHAAFLPDPAHFRKLLRVRGTGKW